jgi:hypothetical protein
VPVVVLAVGTFIVVRKVVGKVDVTPP